jgi:hypothetical protein
MNTVLVLMMCGTTIGGNLAERAPHTQSAEDASAPADDVAHLPGTLSHTLIGKTCTVDAYTHTHMCTARYTSRESPGDSGVAVVRQGHAGDVLVVPDTGEALLRK